MEHVRSKHRAGFATLSVYLPAVEDHGGLNRNDLSPTSGATVQFVVPRYDDYHDAETLVLFWGSTELTRRAVGSADNNGQPISLNVQRSAISPFGDGTFNVTVQLSRQTGNPIVSAPFPVLVKTSPPGGIDPNPSTPVTNENLAKVAVRPSPVPHDQSDVNVVVSHPSGGPGPYANAARGDKVYVSWHGRLVPDPQVPHPHPIDDTDLQRNEFAMVISRRIIDDAGAGDIVVMYHVVDTVANDSLWSPEHIEKVPGDNPGTPPRPWVNDTVGNAGTHLLLDSLLGRPVTLLVTSHTGLVGDTVRALWTPATGTPYATAWQPVLTNDQPLTFEVPFADANTRVGTVDVTYEIARAGGGATITSQARRLEVTRAINPPNFAKPIVVQADANGDVNPMTADKLSVRIPTSAVFQPGDILTLSWKGPTSAGSREVRESAPSAGMEIPLEQAVLAHGQGDTVQVSYAVTRGANTLSSEITTVHVLAIRDDSTALPRPLLREAGAKELDLGAFSGDAHGEVERYRLAANDQRFWFSITGYDAAGNRLTLDVAKGERIGDVSPARLPLGTVPRGDLQRFKDGSDITLTLHVTFDGSTDIQDAVRFRSTNLIIRQTGATRLPKPSVAEAGANDEVNPFTATTLTVRIPSSVDFQAGDTLDVAWKGSSTEGSRTVHEPQPSTGMSVRIDTDVLAFNQGETVAVGYTRRRGGIDATSATYTVAVERIHDDSAALPRPVVSEGPDRVLDLSTFPGDAHATVEPFHLAQIGQRQWVTLTGTRAQDGSRVVLEASKGTRLGSVAPPAIALATCGRKWLEDLKDNTLLAVDLWVTFNGSQDKQAAVHLRTTDLTVRIPSAIAFQPPRVTEAEPDGKTLVPFKAKDHLNVYISSRDTFQPGDVLEVQWRGENSAGTRIVPVAGTPKPGMSVPIDPQVLAVNQGGAVNVTFSVVRAGVTHTSPRLQLAVKRIEDDSDDWPRPIVTEGPDYELNLTKFTGPAHATVEPFAFIAVNQRYWVEAIGVKHLAKTTWFVATAKPFTTTGGAAIAIGEIGRNWLDDLDDNSPLEIHLWVSFDGGNNRAKAVHFRHTRLTLKKRGGTRRDKHDPGVRHRLAPGAAPPAPTLPGHGDRLDAFALAKGFRVELPAVDTAPGSSVTLYIDGYDASSSLEIGPAPYAPGLVFTVDAPALHANVGGQLAFRYRLVAPASPPVASAVRKVTVGLPDALSGAFIRLTAPGVPSALIDLGTFTGDLAFTQPPWPLMRPGSRYWLSVKGGMDPNYYEFTLRDGIPVTAAECLSGITAKLPRVWLEALPLHSSLVAWSEASFGADETPVAMNITPWTIWHEGWHATCDFEEVRGAPSVALGKTLVVPGFMDVHFQSDTYTGADNRLGIDAPGFEKPGFYGGNMLYIGYPETHRHATLTYVKLHGAWHSARLVITSLNGRATVLFEDDEKRPLASYDIVGTAVADAHVVHCHVDPGQIIRYIVIEANDLIRLDRFQFR